MTATRAPVLGTWWPVAFAGAGAGVPAAALAGATGAANLEAVTGGATTGTLAFAGTATPGAFAPTAPTTPGPRNMAAISWFIGGGFAAGTRRVCIHAWSHPMLSATSRTLASSKASGKRSKTWLLKLSWPTPCKMRRWAFFMVLLKSSYLTHPQWNLFVNKVQTDRQ